MVEYFHFWAVVAADLFQIGAIHLRGPCAGPATRKALPGNVLILFPSTRCSDLTYAAAIS